MVQITLKTSRGKEFVQVDGQLPMTVIQLKKLIQQKKKSLYSDRQGIKREAKGKMLKDSETLSESDTVLIFKDLGAQVGWSTVFLSEYMGPLFAYMLFYCRPEIVYGAGAADAPRHYVVQWAAMAWCFHYIKRVLETIFVHRFSHATMPIFNLFKNCSYYWGFAAFVSYFVNHPQYTALEDDNMILAFLIGFIVCEYGNFAIHCALRDLRPAGSKERKIPMPTGNPMTQMFSFCSCANYTYEIGSWFFFTLMTCSVASGLFLFAGAFQMIIWAKGKQRNYRKEFPSYPKSRKAIIPFLI